MKELIKKIGRSFFVLLIFVSVAGCGSMSSPADDVPGGGDPNAVPPVAMPSPPMLEASGKLIDKMFLEVEGSVTREVGSIEGLDVYVTNATVKQTISVKTIADGTFDAEIDAREGHLIIMIAIDPETGQQSNTLSGVIPFDNDNVIFVDTDSDDFDGDGHDDDVDAFPTNPNEWIDSDGDLFGDNGDTCPYLANGGQVDTDADGDGNECDDDDDDDAVLDGDDNCPLVSNFDQMDDDGDGFGDSCDTCLGLADANQHDTDGDGLGDVCDPDIDNDGILNGDEPALGRDPYVNEPALVIILGFILDD